MLELSEAFTFSGVCGLMSLRIHEWVLNGHYSALVSPGLLNILVCLHQGYYSEPNSFQDQLRKLNFCVFLSFTTLDIGG